MYQRSYGETHFPEGFDEGLGFAHTNDNIGPQSVPQAVEAYRDIVRAHPGADDSRPRRSRTTAPSSGPRARRVPGGRPASSATAGSTAPPATRQDSRASVRCSGSTTALQPRTSTPQRLAFGRGLDAWSPSTPGASTSSPTCATSKAWDRPAFEAARKAKSTASPTPKPPGPSSAPISTPAVAQLDAADRQRAAAALAETRRRRCRPKRTARPELSRSAAGASSSLPTPATSAPIYHSRRFAAHRARRIAHRLPLRELRCRRCAPAHGYLPHPPRGTGPSSITTSPASTDAARPFRAFSRRVFRGTRVRWAARRRCRERRQLLSAPRPRSRARLRRAGDGLLLTLVIRGKPANRMPEAASCPSLPEGATDWHLHKIGLWLRRDRMCHARRRSAAGGLRRRAPTCAAAARCRIVPLDTALVAPQSGDFMTFCKTLPDFARWHPLQPAQQQVGNQLPHVVRRRSGRAFQDFALRSASGARRAAVGGACRGRCSMLRQSSLIGMLESEQSTTERPAATRL